MISLPTGLLFMLVVVFTAFGKGTTFKEILNPHALSMVFLGTLAVLAISNSALGLRTFWRGIRRMFQAEPSLVSLNRAILKLNHDRNANFATVHPLIGYAQELWESGVDDQLFSTLLHSRFSEINNLTFQPVALLRNLSKYPPALGMTGTVIGMIGLFSKLNDNQQSSLGPSLALAMTATLYGLLLANGILMPLADRMAMLHLRAVTMNEHVFKALILINNREPENLLKGELDAYAA
jgi:chemotaxis protein MotA